MSEQKKAIEMTPEELERWLDSLEIEDTAPTYYFSNPDPYAKVEPLPYEQRLHHFRLDGDGHIHVKNLSAFWLPEFTLQKEIGGTIYTVTGTYDGTETLDKKMERIMAEKFTGKLEDTE